MEIYRGSVGAKVGIDMPGIVPNIATGDVVKAFQGSQLVYTFTSTDIEGKVTLPASLTMDARELYIHWTLNIAGEISEVITDVQIVAPIIPISEIQSITGKTQEESIRLEKRVRRIIESYTNNKFYPYRATINAAGGNGNRILLLDRLIELESISFGDYQYSIDGVKYTNYSIEVDTSRWLSIKSDYDGIQNVIWAPLTNGAFSSSKSYRITGIWGYPSVPPAVQEAARLLVEDYGCNDSVYRQRGVKVVSGVSMRLELSPVAFSGTGNLDADALLSPYVRSDMYVI